MIRLITLASTLFMCLSVFILALSSGPGQLETARAQSGGIITEDADAELEFNLVTSTVLMDAASDVPARIVTEYADSVMTLGSQESGQLETQAATVSPRILVEYADSTLPLELTPPLLVSNEYPIADAGTMQTVSPGTTVTFNGSGSSDPDGSIVSYEWDFGDGTDGTGITTTHVYTAENVYTVMLTVTDNDGAEATDTMTVRVMQENNPPAINSLQADEVQIIPGASVGLTASASDPDGDTLVYNWSCADGSITGTGPSITWIAPERNGTYQISLEVNDTRGGISSDSISIRVEQQSSHEQTQEPGESEGEPAASNSDETPASPQAPGGDGLQDYLIYLIAFVVVLLATSGTYFWRRRKIRLEVSLYKQKLEQWEKEGYDVSSYKKRWFE